MISCMVLQPCEASTAVCGGCSMWVEGVGCKLGVACVGAGAWVMVKLVTTAVVWWMGARRVGNARVGVGRVGLVV